MILQGQSFMSELYRHIGPDTDVPAGDIGVGGREIGYLYGEYKKLTNRWQGVLTGKPLTFGGLKGRAEATGYGAVWFLREMLKHNGESLEGKTVVVSGYGNVTWGTIQKLNQLGAKVITISNHEGYILDETGAEKLLGKGDMLITKNATTERVQCGYASSAEIDAITRAIESQKGYRKSFNTPYYLPEVKDEGEGGSEGGSGGGVDMGNLDSKFEEAARLVVTTQRGSTSDLQRRLGMGYAKAGRVMDQLEAAGVVGPQNGSRPREVLVSSLDELETILKAFMK